MFSHTTQDGTRIVVGLTPNNTVVMRITHAQRVFTLDITETAWGQVILSRPGDKLRLAEDMSEIGRFWQGVNSHYVSLNAGKNYRIACPEEAGFRSRSALLTLTREERIALRFLKCQVCGAEVTIPDHERSLYAQGQQLRIPTWKKPEEMAVGV